MWRVASDDSHHERDRYGVPSSHFELYYGMYQWRNVAAAVRTKEGSR
jgi:hypothetical protein